MPRNIVQDVIPRGSRRTTERNSPLPATKASRESVLRKNEKNSVSENIEGVRYVEREEKFVSWQSDSKSNGSRFWLWTIGVVAVCILVILLGNYFSSAILTITPRSQKVSINLDLTAKAKPLNGELSYTTFATVRDRNETIAADSEKNVEKRASGRIVVYNNYSTSVQRLIKNTRFETPDGLIYKIAESITVPGRKSVEGKSVPGSTEAVVYAESAGEEYNIGLTDFTVPGFKSNSERFNAFYGRSKTPMTGGKIGTEKAVSDEKMLQARARLEAGLLQELTAEAKKQTTSGALFYDAAYRIEFEPVLSSAKAQGNAVTLTERAHFTAFYLKRDELSDAIASNSLETFDKTPVEVPDAQNLKFQMKTMSQFGTTNTGPIEFTLKGTANILWKFDDSKLKSDLVGKNKTNLSDVVSKYPSILRADVTIRPFWKGVFPANSKKINILTTQIF